jgi:small GTP-binding protein
MPSDMELIKQLEKEIGRKLEERKFEEIGNYRNHGYAIGENGEVVGLNLDKIGLKPVPVSLSKFHHLKILRLYDTNLTDISFLQGLSNLKKLDLISNQIKELPEALVELGLEIDVDDEFPFGQKIYLYNNPLEKPPLEIVKKGIPAIKVYFKSLKEEKTLPLNEVKVLLVGDGGAGKTSLVKRLLRKTFDKDESQTHGINITPCNLKKDGSKIKINFWDFGGQEIMHATHQFFLSRRSLYILVLDGRRDEKTEYWLNHIKSFGGDSPVLVVLNKIDQNPGFDVNRLFLKSKYPNIKGFFPVSCATGKGIKDFAGELTKELAAIDHIRTQWAESWFNVKERLENMTEHYISFDEYQKMCAKENIKEEDARKILLDFLNDLGVALHFEDLSLADTHVLDPKWLTNAVYKIINSEILSNCKGVLKLSLLDKILKPKDEEDYVYPKDKYSYIIDLMHKFELCFKMEDQRVLVPDLLDVGEPPIDFDFKNSLKFQVHYEFLPRSVMPRFIVKRHNEIKEQLRWRTGVVLENKEFGATAVVKMDERDKKIFIDIDGPQKRDYLATIIHTLREIHGSFEKIAPDERVPLPDNPVITVSYFHLLQLEKMGEMELVPEGAAKRYHVKELLDGIKPVEERQKEAEQLLRENKIILNISPTQIADLKTTQIQQARQDVNVDVDVVVNLSIALPTLQEEFDDLKELLLKEHPELKEKLTGLGGDLNALSAKTEKEKLTGPLNNLRIFLKKLGDEKSDYSKILKGAKKGVDMFKKVGRTYNKVAQWLALPQVPDVLLK